MAQFSRTLKFDFFQVIRKKGKAPQLGEVMPKIQATPVEERVFPHTNSQHMQLHDLRPWNGQWEGRMMLIRTGRTALKVNLTGRVDPLRMGPREGIAEESVFLFDPSHNVIVVERSRYIAPSAVIKMLHNVSKIAFADWEFRFILRPDVMEQLEHAGSFRTFQFEIARPRRNLYARGEIGAFIDMAEHLDSARISVQVGVAGASKNGLKRKGVMALIRELLSVRKDGGKDEANDVKRIRVVAQEGEDEVAVPLDLLNDRLTADSEVYLDDRERVISFESRAQAVREAWVKNREVCRKYLEPDVEFGESES